MSAEFDVKLVLGVTVGPECVYIADPDLPLRPTDENERAEFTFETRTPYALVPETVQRLGESALNARVISIEPILPDGMPSPQS